MRTRFKRHQKIKFDKVFATFLNRAILGVVGEGKTNPFNLSLNSKRS